MAGKRDKQAREGKGFSKSLSGCKAGAERYGMLWVMRAIWKRVK